jgi:hypothetical protein
MKIDNLRIATLCIGMAVLASAATGGLTFLYASAAFLPLALYTTYRTMVRQHH